MKIHPEVRRRRLQLGLTIEQLSRRAKLTPNYVGSIEAGQRDPSLSTICALARGLGVAPAELIGGIDGLSSPALEAARLFDASPSDVQDAVARLLRATGKRPRRRS